MNLPSAFVLALLAMTLAGCDMLGIESPDGRSDPAHDRTKRYHGFLFLQDILDQNSSAT